MKKWFRQIASVISACGAASGNFIEHSWGWTFFIVLFTVLRIVIGVDRGIWVSNSPHDDLLYVQLARHIVDGEWLGPLHSMTLAKSCIYPVFIAFCIGSGIPYLMVLDILLCGTMYLCVMAMRPCLNRSMGLILYVALIFNPAFFLSQRLLIQDLLSILIAGQIFCLIACWLRRDHELRKVIPWLIGSGFFFALTAHIREEGNVFAAVFAGIYVLLLADAVFRKRTPRKSIARAALFYVLIPVICFFGVRTAICAVNERCYGKFETCMRNSRAYKRFVGSLFGAARQLDPKWDIRIPVRYEIWDKLFQLSPTLKTLQPHLKPSSWWHTAATGRFPPEMLKKTPELANNTKGGFVQWEILDAMQQAGYFASGDRSKSDEFFVNAVEDLKRAAAKGALPGFAPRCSNLVPWSWQMVDWFVFKFRLDVKTLFYWNVKFLGLPFIAFPAYPGKAVNKYLLDYHFAPVRANENLNLTSYLVTGWGFFPEDKQNIKAHNFADSLAAYYQPVNRPDVQKHLRNLGYAPDRPDAGFRFILQGDRIKIKNNSNKYVLDARILPRPRAKMISIDSVAELKPLSSINKKRVIIRNICRFFQVTGKYLSFLAVAVLILGILSVFCRKSSLKQFLDSYLPGIVLLGCGFGYFCLIIFANVMLHCPRYAPYYLPAFALLYSGVWAVIISGCAAVPVWFRRAPSENSTAEDPE